MSKAKLKKTLKEMEQGQLVDMICELYDARKDFKNYLEYWLDPDPQKLAEETKKKIFKLFFMPRGKPRKKPDFVAVKNLRAEFDSMCYEPEWIGDVVLYSIEQYVEWLMGQKKVLSHEEKVSKLFHEAYEFIEKNEFADLYGIRHDTVLSKFNALMSRGDIVSYHRRRWW